MSATSYNFWVTAGLRQLLRPCGHPTVSVDLMPHISWPVHVALLSSWYRKPMMPFQPTILAE